MALAAAGSRRAFESYAIWLLLAVTMTAAAGGIPAFRHPENIANLLRQSSVLGLLAVGQTFVIAAGMIDLSVGVVAGLVVVLSCWILAAGVAPEIVVLAGMLALGTGIGVFNGFLLNLLRIHPLILTFGMLSVIQGLIFTLTDRSIGRASPLLQDLANGSMLGVPQAALLLLAVVVVFHIVLTRTRFGHHLLAVGGNAESARRAGINVSRVRLACFAVSGFCAALGGLLLAGRLGTGYPLAGSGLELDAIVAVVLGGTALSGGRASIVGAIGGVLVLAIISNALNLLEVSAFVQMFVKGAIVVAAILVNQPRSEP
jgi:ribose/xylose/arabinose/galactoside ABC-type transport system permease subunit